MHAAFFDLDDTILDRSGSLRNFVEWQAKDALRLSAADSHNFVERFIALDQNGLVRKDKVYESLIEEFGISDWAVDELLNIYLLTFCAFCKPRKGALAALKGFQNSGYKIGLVSNGKTPFQERNFHALGFGDLFDCIIVSEAVGVRKPDKAIFELGCRAANVSLEKSYFIGDNPKADIEGAKKAGMKTIYVPVNSDVDRCEYADATFNDLSELPGYITHERFGSV